MPNEPDSYHERSINHDLLQKTATSLAKLQWEIQPQKRNRTSPTNTNNTPRYSQSRNPKDYLNTRYGITPSNYFQVPLAPYQDASYLLHKKKSPKQRSSWKSTCDETPFDHRGALMQPTSSLSKRRMANSGPYRTTDH